MLPSDINKCYSSEKLLGCRDVSVRQYRNAFGEIPLARQVSSLEAGSAVSGTALRSAGQAVPATQIRVIRPRRRSAGRRRDRGRPAGQRGPTSSIIAAKLQRTARRLVMTSCTQSQVGAQIRRRSCLADMTPRSIRQQPIS